MSDDTGKPRLQLVPASECSEEDLAAMDPGMLQFFEDMREMIIDNQVVSVGVACVTASGGLVTLYGNNDLARLLAAVSVMRLRIEQDLEGIE